MLQAMRGGGSDGAAGAQTPGHLAGHPAHFAPFGSDGSVDLDAVSCPACCDYVPSRLHTSDGTGPPGVLRSLMAQRSCMECTAAMDRTWPWRVGGMLSLGRI